MNWALVTSTDQFWGSSSFPVWLTLAAAAFFAVLVLATLVRADKSVANVVLTVITLLAIGAASAVAIRGFGGDQTFEARSLSAPAAVAMPALSCIDGLAGDVVEVACEKALFGTPGAVAAAVSYVASEIGRLRSFGHAAGADNLTLPEMQALRRTIERDRYGLVAHVLTARDHCRPSDCAAFQLLSDRSRVAANMEEGTYEKLVTRYAPSWNRPAESANASEPGMLTSLPASEPTGKPTNAEFPSSASIPPVSIMTPEPPTGATPPSSPASPSTSAQATPKPRPTPAKRPAATRSAPKPHAEAPVRLTPQPPTAGAPN